jgi:hypothetical protein
MSRFMRQTYMEAPRRSSTRPAYRAERNAIASAIAHPTMTSEVTAPAVTLAFSFRVVGRSVSVIPRQVLGAWLGSCPKLSRRSWPCCIQTRGGLATASAAGKPRPTRTGSQLWIAESGSPGLRRPGAPSAGYEGAPEPALLHHASMVRAPISKQEPCLFSKTVEAADRKSRRSDDWSDWGACRHGGIGWPRLRQALAAWAHPEFRHGRSNCGQASGSGSPNLDRRA